MKRTVLAVAASCCAVASYAQSSVTLFGVVDMGVGRVQSTGNGSVNGMLFGGSSTSRLGFKGVEDLGNGLKASFWLEGQLATDVGQGAATGGGLDFARRSTVSLTGPFGEVRLGRDYAPTYLSRNTFDPWVQRGLGMVEFTGYTAGGLAAYSRNSNGISYFLPSGLGGFYGTVKYAFGEQSNQSAVESSTVSAAAVTTDKSGSYYGGRFGFAKDAYDVALAYGVFTDAVRTVTGTPTRYYHGDYKIFNVGASYNFGIIKAMGLYQRERMAGVGEIQGFGYDTYSLSATAPVGSGLLRASIAKYDVQNSTNGFKKFSVGYSYFLSKRTSLYGDVSQIRNEGASKVVFGGISSSIPSPTPTAGGNVTGFAVGIKHVF